MHQSLIASCLLSSRASWFVLRMARHVSCMRHLPAGSIAALLILVACVMWHYAEHGADETIATHDDVFFSSTAATAFTYMSSINNVVFAYNNQFIAPQLTGEQKPEPTTMRMHTAAVICLIMCFVVYFFTSVFGVLAFGIGDQQKDSLVYSGAAISASGWKLWAHPPYLPCAHSFSSLLVLESAKPQN